MEMMRLRLAMITRMMLTMATSMMKMMMRKSIGREKNVDVLEDDGDDEAS